MATGSSVTDSNDTLICPVCIDTFQDPRLLPCGHTLCGPNSEEKCIKKLETRDGTITCPTCRKTCKATDASVSFTLANLVAEMKSKRICEQHAQEILYYCDADEQEICVTCWQIEHMGRNHKVAPISTKADRKLLQQWRERDSKQLEANSRKEIELIIKLETTLKQLKDRQMGYHDSLAGLMDEDRDSKDPDPAKLKDFFDLELKKSEDDLDDWKFLAGQVDPRKTPTISAFHGSGLSGSVSSMRKGEMYFDPETSSSGEKSYRFTEDELREELLNVIDPNENILKVFVFESPLSPWQLTKIILKHNFIVLKTNKWWWSLEKNTEGITVQRDKNLAAVRDRYRQNERTKGFRGTAIVIKDKGQGDMEDLVRWLWRKDVLKESYGLLSSNCHHFAKTVFDHVAVNKSYQVNGNG